MSLRIFHSCFCLLFALVLVSCGKHEKKAVDPLSYLVLEEEMEKNRAIEDSRTQIIAIVPSKEKSGITSLKFAFAMDSSIPEVASISPQHAYAVRFTLQDSLFRSKRMGGGTFILKFQKTAAGYSIGNFRRTATGATRWPEFIVDATDTIVNPEIVDIQDGRTGRSILVGGGGVLTAIKPRVYSINILFRDIAGDEWALDHGYIRENPETKKFVSILNSTNSGLKIDFPFRERQATPPNYDLDKLGTI